jgi:hypothetical protein
MNTPLQSTGDLESKHKHNKYGFKKQGEKNEHLQFQCNCRNVLLSLSSEIKVHYILDNHHLCFMTVVACLGTRTNST